MKFVYDAKLIRALLIFQFLVKFKVEAAFPYQYILELPSSEYGWRKLNRDKGHLWASIVWYAAIDTLWKNLQYLAVVN